MEIKFSVILGNLGNTCDRFLSSGYKKKKPAGQMFREAASIEGIAGVELVGTWDLRKDNVRQVKKLLSDNGLKCVSVIPDHFSRSVYGKGAFTSREKAVRKQAVRETKEIMDMAVALDCGLVNIWPGQDGYDYPFQGDFLAARGMIIEGIREAADHNKRVRIALEYKLKEPRNRCYISRMSDTLLLVNRIDRENVGVTIDTGHAMVAYENMAESAAVLLDAGKLFHLHFNDNYTCWDDDMIVGSVHTVGYLELLYWLRKLDYSGWLSMDQYPYREDGKRAIEESVKWLKKYLAALDSMDPERIDGAIARGDATEVSALLREMI